jgi:FixJ family two-component response regulator
MKCSHPIVILEDDVFYGKMLMNFLLNQDFKNVELFHDEDLCLQNVSLKPTLYLLDFNLKTMTGLDVMQQIIQKNPNANFVYISGQDYSSIVLKVMRLGAVDYIEKNRHAFYHLKNTLDKIKNNIPLIKHNLFNTNDFGINLN